MPPAPLPLAGAILLLGCAGAAQDATPLSGFPESSDSLTLSGRWFRAEQCRQAPQGRITLRIGDATVRVPEARLRSLVRAEAASITLRGPGRPVVSPPAPDAGCPEEPLRAASAFIDPASGAGPQGLSLIERPDGPALSARGEAVLRMQRDGGCRATGMSDLLVCEGRTRAGVPSIVAIAAPGEPPQPSGVPLNAQCMPGPGALRCLMQEDLPGRLRAEFSPGGTRLDTVNLRDSLGAVLADIAAMR